MTDPREEMVKSAERVVAYLAKLKDPRARETERLIWFLNQSVRAAGVRLHAIAQFAVEPLRVDAPEMTAETQPSTDTEKA